MSATPGVAPRVLAAKVLDAVIHRGRSLKGELALALPQLPDVRDRALLEAMCFSALRQRARYDAALQLWLQKPLGEKDGDLRALLLVGFAQIDAMGLPAHAALSATVEATRALARPHQAGMINAAAAARAARGLSRSRCLGPPGRRGCARKSIWNGATTPPPSSKPAPTPRRSGCA